MKLLLHPQTSALLTSLAASPPQTLLFVGPIGSGKQYIATTWLQSALEVPPTNIRVIAPDEKAGISIAQIRQLYHATRAKQTEGQYFILDGAGTMSAGAQNAFLKLLEEPNANISFILTATTPEALLPTIRSRVQQVSILPVSQQTMQEHLAEYTLPAAATAQILFVASGRVGLATHLAQDSASFQDYQQLASRAKQLLTSPSFERLTLLTSVISDRSQAITFLEIAAHMASLLLQKATKKADQQLWTSRLAALHDTLERLSANGNLKIQLTRLALTL